MSDQLPTPLLNVWAFGQALLQGGENVWAQPTTLGKFGGELRGLLGSKFDFDIDIDGAIGTEHADGPMALEDALLSQDVAERLAAGLAALGIASGDGGARNVVSISGITQMCEHFEDSPDEDEIDDLIMALGDLARHLFQLGVTTLLIREPDADITAQFGPLVRIAQHHQSDVVIASLDATEQESVSLPCYRLLDNQEALAWLAEYPDVDVQPESLTYICLPSDLDPEALQRLVRA